MLRTFFETSLYMHGFQLCASPHILKIIISANLPLAHSLGLVELSIQCTLNYVLHLQISQPALSGRVVFFFFFFFTKWSFLSFTGNDATADGECLSFHTARL